MCRDIEAGRYGADAAVVTVTFDDAVTNGLYERVCFMKGTPATAEGKKEWYSKIRNAYGVRKAAMREELDAIPRDGSGVSLPGVWIENAMAEERPVVRLALDDDFVRKSEAERRSFVEDWIRRQVEPALALLDPKLQSVFAQDFARATATSRCSVLGRSWRTSAARGVHRRDAQGAHAPTGAGHLVHHRAHAAAAAAAPWMQQVRRDPGRIHGRQVQHDHVHQIKLNRAWYGTWMPKRSRASKTG